MGMLRIGALAALLAGFVWFNFFNMAPAHVLGQSMLDRFDERPARRILFVGNSRMFYNDMPYMVRKIADSAGAPQKYQVTMWALPGETLERHWTRGEVRRLIGEGPWDDFLLQADSGAHSDDSRRSSFAYHGARLIGEAGSRDVPTGLIVGWTYGASVYAGLPEDARSTYHSLIQNDHRRLARDSGARLVNVGGAWKDLEQEEPPFKLTTDGNHPTIHGSYLSALMAYAHLSGGDVGAVTYAPDGIKEADAALIRKVASESIRYRIDA